MKPKEMYIKTIFIFKKLKWRGAESTERLVGAVLKIRVRKKEGKNGGIEESEMNNWENGRL